MTTHPLPVAGEQVRIGPYIYDLAPGEGVAGGKITSYAEKVTTGEHTAQDDPLLSSLTVVDHRGGIGKSDYGGDPARNINRCAWSECNLRYSEHLILPPLVYRLLPPATAAPDVALIKGFKNNIYAWFGASVRRWLPDTPDNLQPWTAVLHTLPGNAPPTDGLVVEFTGTSYLFVCNGSGFAYTTDGTTWESSTAHQPIIAGFWDDKLYTMDANGVTRHTIDFRNWSDDATLHLPEGRPKRLLQGRKPGGEFILYCMTEIGLYQHDAGGPKWSPTTFSLPLDEDNGNGTAVWREFIFTSSGLGGYQYNSTGQQAVLSTMGPDKDDGLPYEQRGRIVGMIGAHTDLIALIAGEELPLPERLRSSDGGLRSNVISLVRSRSSVLAWNGSAWMCLHNSDVNARTITGAAEVSSARGRYRLWFAEGNVVRWLELSKDIVNPNETPRSEFAERASHIMPWFDAAEVAATKVGLLLRAQVSRMSQTEKMRAQVGFDRSPVWYPLRWMPVLPSIPAANIPPSGYAELTFNGIFEAHLSLRDAEDVHGALYNSFRWRYDLERQTGHDSRFATPDVNITTHLYYKENLVRYQYTMRLDLSRRSGDRDRAAMLEEIRGLSRAPGLKEFVYENSGQVHYIVIPQEQELNLPTELPTPNTLFLTVLELV